jgi:meiotically up-regulated gene 157 (Mug157) protein
MHPGVGERKWEIDSLCYTVRLAHGYWKATGDISPFDVRWRSAAQTILSTFREQQRKDGPGPYTFQRESTVPTETQFLGGYGNPTRPVGLIHSMFRRSDDACLYPLFVPANLFAIHSAALSCGIFQNVLKDIASATECAKLSREIQAALDQHAHMESAARGEVWAYEVDGYGNQLFMDDANAPSLLSLPYLDCCAISDPLYLRTRAAVWSKDNPYFS